MSGDKQAKGSKLNISVDEVTTTAVGDCEARLPHSPPSDVSFRLEFRRYRRPRSEIDLDEILMTNSVPKSLRKSSPRRDWGRVVWRMGAGEGEGGEG